MFLLLSVSVLLMLSFESEKNPYKMKEVIKLIFHKVVVTRSSSVLCYTWKGLMKF